VTAALPNPQELDLVLTVDGVEEYKRYDCVTYAKCLDVAGDAGWQQFHCNDCQAYVPLPKEDPSRRLFAHVGLKLLKNGRNR
jgi:hypothetical protein